MKYVLTLLAFVVALAIPASAEVNFTLTSSAFSHCAPKSSTTVKDTIQISTFSFGGADAGNGTRPILQNLVIAKNFDGCSGDLVTSFLTTNVIPEMNLTGIEATGVNGTKNTVLTISLSDVIVTKYLLNSDTYSNASAEQISFSFSKACIATPTTKFCYDVKLNTLTPN